MKDFRQYNVVYSSPSLSDKGSMPIGGGEIGASVFATCEKLSFYISRTDSLSKADRNLKLYMVNISFQPNILAFKNFRQVLHLESGIVEITASEEGRFARVEIFADRQTDFIRIGVESDFELSTDFKYFNWRNKENTSVNELGINVTKLSGITESPDVVYKHGANQCFYHLNSSSAVNATAELEALEPLKVSDNLINRCLGGVLQIITAKNDKYCVGGNILANDKLCYTQEAIVKTFCAIGANPKEEIQRLINLPNIEFNLAKQINTEFCTNFFQKSYIYVENDTLVKPLIHNDFENIQYEVTAVNSADSNVTRAYILCKYMQKSCTGAHYPIRFNGGHFNLSVGTEYGKASMPMSITVRPPAAPEIGRSPHERSWGNMILWQNERLPYASMLWQNEPADIKKFFEFYC